MTTNGLILVTGGTGGLGHRMLPRLRAAGRDVRVLSRSHHDSADGIEYVSGDLTKGEGVAAAVEGAEIVLHCAGTGRIKDDTAQARNLVRAAQRAGVAHILNISVVGADRIPVKTVMDRSMFAYFAAQRAVEVVIEESGLPWTNLRAAQFHDGFILAMVRGMSSLPVVPMPSGFRFQPIDADEVAARLADLTLGPPACQVPDIAGPKVYEAEYLLRSYLAVVGKHRWIVKIPVGGGAAAAIRAGANLAPDHAVGHRTWEEFLATLNASSDGAASPASG
ncbi:MAG TPA: NAD(P)-binding oxidoreductase [Candidatus Acidoferrales bacterium]|nr:NAD(P)-binding oxidoreductase [Candidatus Acidoferrales bacterium]